MEVYRELEPHEIGESLESLAKVAAIVCRHDPNAGVTRGEKAADTRRLNASKNYKSAERREDISSMKELFTGENARNLRDSMGYTRPELAAKLGMSASYLAKIEGNTTELGGVIEGEKILKHMQWYHKHKGKMKI